MKQILFVMHSGVIGGPGRSLLRLVEGLPQTYHPKVLVPWAGDYPAFLQAHHVDHTVYGLRMRNLPRLLWDSQQSALIYGNSVNYRVYTAMRAALWLRRPTIWHIREVLPDPTTVGTEQNRYLQLIRRQMLQTDALIAVSHAAADAAARLLKQKRKPHVIYNGVHVEAYSVNRTTARDQLLASLSLAPDITVIVQVGHLDQRKNQIDALEALALVVKTQPNVRLVYLGRHNKDELYSAQLRRRIVQLGLQEHVIFAGFQEEIEIFLTGADIQIHTATQDPHPRAVIEGMAARLPLVAYNVDGVGETVLDGETGFLVPCNDTAGLARSLMQLITKPALRKQMGQQGRQRVEEHFTAQKTADEVYRLIDHVLHGHIM